MQYFKPEGKFFVGDCMPFFHDGVFHLYYLLDENHHQGMNGLGGHQWAHVTSRDLVRWEHHPLAIAITDDWEASICTGSVFYHDGLFRGYYASRKKDGTEHLSVAVSKDGLHFDKTEPRIFASPEGPYRPGPYRDPCVFRDAKTGMFHLIATAELTEPAIPGHGGCLAHLISEDLVTWKTEAPFLVPGYRAQPECADHFLWNGWYYLIFSIDGIAQYRMARDPLGPWTRPPVDTLDSPMARVMKTAEFNNGRRIGVAFLPTTENNRDNGGMQYAGAALFREIEQDADGLLWTKLPPEMTPKAGAPIALKPTGQPEGIVFNATTTEVHASNGLNAVSLAPCPVNARITAEIDASGTGEVGLCLRADTDGHEGYALRFTSNRKKVDLRPCSLGNFEENERHALYKVDGLEHPFHVEIIMKDDIIDVAIETDVQKRCMANRFTEHRGDHLILFARNADAAFRNVHVCPLLEP